MADHGTVEYATAPGNDYPAHESGYEQFVHITVVGVLFAINMMFGLAVGGVMGHWFTALPIFILAIVGLLPGLFGVSRTSSVVAFAICFLIFAFTGLSSH